MSTAPLHDPLTVHPPLHEKGPIVPIVREGPDKGIATPAIIIPFRRSIGRLLSLF